MLSDVFCAAIHGEGRDMILYLKPCFSTMILDIHTHCLPDCTDAALWSGCMNDRKSQEFNQATWISAGIHPWYLSPSTLNEQLDWLESTVKTDKRVLAIGESGLDKLCMTPYKLQLHAFKSVIELSEQYRLPLIIHAVKTFNEIMALKKEIRPSQPWIIHGFRGKKELAESLLRQDFHLSVGEKFNTEAVKTIPSEHLLAETDESLTDISDIVGRLAEVRDKSVDSLRTRLCLNAERLFFHR